MLVNKPVWILDDPLSGLDDKTIINLNTLFEKKLENKGIIIRRPEPQRLTPNQSVQSNLHRQTAHSAKHCAMHGLIYSHDSGR